jgi:hypothetical protein
VDSQTFFKFRRGKCLFESKGGISKKEQSKSTREGMVLKAERFLIIYELRKKHSLAWLFKIGQVSKAGYYKWRKSRPKRSFRLEEDLFIERTYMVYSSITSALWI